MRSARAPRRTWTALAAVLLAPLVTGCLSLPVTGPIHEVGDEQSDTTASGAYYDPKPPVDGATPSEIVLGFLDAMKATPVSTTDAKQYLTVAARTEWHPERRTITYDDAGEPGIETVADTRVAAIQLQGAGAYDGTGVWLGSRGRDRATLSFTLAREDDEWRIASLPQALVVPNSWFAGRFVRVSRYFLDPTRRVLVPETAFVASGEAITTPLVRGLLTGPSVGLADVLASAVPEGLSPGLSVPIDQAGVADVQLTGAEPLRPIAADTMAAQFVWTLRQDPRLRAVRLSLNGRPIHVTGKHGEVPMDHGARYNPVGVDADRSIYGVRAGRVLRGSPGRLLPVRGPWGEAAHDIGALAVSLPGAQAAVVSSAGDDVRLGPVNGAGTPLATVARGRDFLRPAWDLADRLWLMDSGPERARLRVRDREGAVLEVNAPGISGRTVRQFLVSRDGTRVVALIAGARRDRLVVARVRQDPEGRVLGLTEAQPMWLGAVAPEEISAIGWRSPTSVAVLSPIGPELSQVQTTTVDGAPVGSGLPTTIRFRGRSPELLTSPAESSGMLVVMGGSVVDVESVDGAAVPIDDIKLLTWPG